MRVVKFLGAAVLTIAYLPIFLVWQVLRLVGLILWRLPEAFMPRLRKTRAIARFKRKAEAVRQRADNKRRALSAKAAQRNARELASDVMVKLQARRRDIAPSVLERAGAAIRACGEAADVDALESYFTLLTMSDAAHLNAELMGRRAAA